MPPAKPLVDLVAGGGVDFGFQPIPQIFLDPRIEYVGPLPAPYQQYTNYVASQVATSKQSEAYKALLTFLDSPAGGEGVPVAGIRAALDQRGLRPPSRRRAALPGARTISCDSGTGRLNR